MRAAFFFFHNPRIPLFCSAEKKRGGNNKTKGEIPPQLNVMGWGGAFGAAKKCVVRSVVVVGLFLTKCGGGTLCFYVKEGGGGKKKSAEGIPSGNFFYLRWSKK